MCFYRQSIFDDNFPLYAQLTGYTVDFLFRFLNEIIQCVH